MGNSVMAWRAAIGCFAGCSYTDNCISLSDYLALNSLFSGKFDLRLLLIALAILLIIGQIESNPGPPKVSLDDLYKLMTTNNSTLESMQTEIKNNSITTNSIEAKVSETNKSLQIVTKDLQKAKSDISNIQKQNAELQKTVHSLDLKLRKNNIVFYGFCNVSGETVNDIELKITEFCENNLKVIISINDIESCFRVGKNFNRPRPILVRFTNYKIKANLFKNVRNLKGTEFALSDDLSPLERNERSKLIKHKVRASKLNLRTKLYKNMLMIEGVKYSLDELDDPDLLDKIKNNIISNKNLSFESLSPGIDHSTPVASGSKRFRDPNNTPPNPNKIKEPRIEGGQNNYNSNQENL